MDLKHKDAPPQQTIERIREILKSVGTEPTLRLLKNTDNIYSASLYDTACGWRVNGKGTSEAYCIASAYGEAMERLQAYFIYERSDKNDTAAADDFLMYPDEQKCETARVKQDYPFIYEDLRTMFAMECGCRTDEVSEKELDEFLSVYFRDTTVTVPYYSVSEQKVVYLPEQMISATCGSNGLAAGNTPAEALNQGISEILERHVKELIYTKGYTPPELSRAFLSEKLPEIAQTIAEIEAMGPYTVVLKDASLGMGIPVMCALFIDRENQTYHAKFGSGLTMQVAAERCITELFQGFDLKNAESHKRLMTKWDVNACLHWDAPRFRGERLRTDTGSVPVTYFDGGKTWEVADWKTWEGYESCLSDNEKALTFMMEKLRAFQQNVYVRSYGFLGFPAFRIYVPGVSVTHLPLGPRRMRFKTEKTSVDLLKKYPAVRLHERALSECYHFLTEDDNFLLEPFEGVPMEAVRAIFHYVFDHVDKAIAELRSLPDTPSFKKYGCAAMELELQKNGMDVDSRDRILGLFYEETAVKYAKRAFRKDAARSDHAYLIDRVIDPQAKKLFQPSASSGTQARANMHRLMRLKMQQQMPDQAKLKELFVRKDR